MDRTPGSVRELEGAVNTLAASAGQRLADLTADEASVLLGAALRGGPERRITVDEIQKTVAEHFNLKQADLLSERRTRIIARPRQIAMYLCKQLTTRSYPDIGRRFGGRDHTTVLHGVRRIEETDARGRPDRPRCGDPDPQAAGISSRRSVERPFPLLKRARKPLMSKAHNCSGDG